MQDRSIGDLRCGTPGLMIICHIREVIIAGTVHEPEKREPSNF
jgi:hypothetical protein